MSSAAMRMTGLALTMGLCLTPVLSGPASAQTKADARSPMLQKLLDCRKLTDQTERLACYDATTAVFDQAEAKGDVVVVDREQARQVRRQAFGFSMPSLTLFERGESQEELENVSGVVDAARMNGAGKWVIRLKDGATWVQVDSNELSRDPKPGMPIKVRQASLGSFLMTIDNMRAFRARRSE